MLKNIPQTWALLIKALLLEINKAVHETGGVLSAQVADGYRERYRQILEKGHEEYPLPLPPPETQKKRGKIDFFRNYVFK